jgi:serine/threonine protein kinase
MGVVYRALDRQTAGFKDRRPYVAIKVLNEEFKRHPLAVRSLQREARKAQKLAHPNIVTVHDFDRDGGNVYMVMELLSGHSLDQLLRTEAKAGLPVKRVTEIVKALGAALSYAHEQEIVHSDFKPSNAFITDEGVVKVLDFGIARAAPRADRPGDKTIFDAGQLGAISPPYASLEMLNGEQPDPRDDVYALACVTYELLTGRHPFNRIDAAKAREAGLRPPPVRGLSRAQRLALRQGLAFERAARAPSVDALVTPFTVKRTPPLLWGAVAAAVAAVIVAAAYLVPGAWNTQKARGLESQLQSTDAADFTRALASLQAAPSALRERVLLDEATRNALVAHFRSAVQRDIAPPDLNFAKARASLAELAKLLPDSSIVSAMQQQLETNRQSELQREIEHRDALLTQGVLDPSQGADNVLAALERIRRIDPNNLALSDPKLATTYAAAAATNMSAGHLELAAGIADSALKFAPNDAKLQELKDRITAELQRTANARRAAELEQRFAALNLSSPGFLDAVLASRDDLISLAAAAPTNPTLVKVQSALQSIVLQRVRQQLAAHDIAGARDLLLNVKELLQDQVLTSAQALVLDAAREQEDRTLDLLDRLRSAALTGRLTQGAGSASELYPELQRAGASPDVLAEARDLLAYGYLVQARRTRAAGDTPNALKALAAGRALQASSTLQQRLDAAQTLFSAGPARPGAIPTTAVAGQLDATRERFAQSLRSGTLGATELTAMADSLDQLEALGSSAQEVDSGLRQVEQRVIGEVERLQQQSGPERAQLFAREASAIVLGSERIAEVARELRHAATQSAGTRFAPETLALRNELVDRTSKPEANERWGTAVLKLLEKLTPLLPPDDTALTEARRVAVATFVHTAADAREAKRFPAATSALALARQFDPQSQDVARESAALEHDRSAVESAAAHEEQQQGIDALKSKLASQAASGDMAGATATANYLRRVLAGSVYIARDMPQVLIDGYLHLARSQLAAGHVDASLQTLGAARQKFGSAPDLKNLEIRYVAVGDAYDRLSTAVSLNVTEQRRALDKLRASEGAEYPITEHMLARTLANRIADERAAGRTTVAATLLEGGRAVFPDSAAVLEQGTAGALPKTGLAVTEQ